MKCFLVRFCSVFYHFFYFFTLQANLSLLKEQCHGDFSSPVFFIKQLLLVPIDMPRNDFEFFSNIRGVIRIRNRLPGDEYRESIRIP
jgi:hypothetical protein